MNAKTATPIRMVKYIVDFTGARTLSMGMPTAKHQGVTVLHLFPHSGGFKSPGFSAGDDTPIGSKIL